MAFLGVFPGKSLSHECVSNTLDTWPALPPLTSLVQPMTFQISDITTL